MIARYLLRIVCATLIAVPLGLRAAAPDAIKASYSVFKEGVRIGTAQESFEKNGAKYHIVSESTPSERLALFIRTRIKVQSTGTVTAQGLRPDQFDYGRLDDARKNVRATFDWSSKQLLMSFDGRNETASLLAGSQDRLSIMYQFMFLPLDQLKVIALPMTNGKKLEPYSFQVVGSEIIDTPLGKLNAWRVVRQREAGDNNAIEVWLARERSLIPVKLLIVESDGSRFEQVITRLEYK